MKQAFVQTAIYYCRRPEAANGRRLVFGPTNNNPPESTMNQDQYFIIREGKAYLEHAVRVGRFGGRSTWWINPAELVRQATGLHLGREGCVVSFADGIQSTGALVHMNDRRNGRRTVYLHRNAYPSVLVYWLAGRLWTQGEWNRFTQALNTHQIPMGETRKQIMEATATYGQRHLWDRTLRIILPS